VISHKKARPIKPDKLKNVVHEVCADECSDDELMIPELDESGKEAPTMSTASATSISWTSDDISPHIVPFTGNSGIEMSLPDDGSAFAWLKVFLDDDLISVTAN
jgi:hypothetical protein